MKKTDRPYWVSWWWVPALGGWELHSPWWVTGTRGEADDEAQSICAAVMATSEEAAKEVIRAAHDNRPRAIQWRFANECPEGWSPFTDRFPRRKWMKWPT